MSNGPRAQPRTTTVRVRIAGEEYTIRTDADEAYTRRCAALVDERMKTMGGDATGAALRRAAIMAALSIADDFFQYQANVEERARALTERLEEGLAQRGPKSEPDDGKRTPDLPVPDLPS